MGCLLLGERLVSGVQNCHLLSENEAIVVQALDAMTDTSDDGEM